MLQKKPGEKIVLIVEDSATQAMQLQSLLAENGLATMWARDGEEGLHCAQAFLPDVIVLDIELPGMNGLQLCKYLQESKYTKAIPIIMLTHLNYREVAKYGIKTGNADFIPKDAFADAVILETLKRKGFITTAAAE